MQIDLDGRRVIVGAPVPEIHDFATAEAADKRARFMREALTWVGTPFGDCADIKGRGGAVDCAMLLVRCSVDTGLLAPFDPRPYSPRWHLHRSEEKILNMIEDTLGAREVQEPRPGDVIVYQFGRTFSHCAIVLSSKEIVHAWFDSGMCLTSRRDEALLNWIAFRGQNIKRPSKSFCVWGG